MKKALFHISMLLVITASEIFALLLTAGADDLFKHPRFGGGEESYPIFTAAYIISMIIILVYLKYVNLFVVIPSIIISTYSLVQIFMISMTLMDSRSYFDVFFPYAGIAILSNLFILLCSVLKFRYRKQHLG